MKHQKPFKQKLTVLAMALSCLMPAAALAQTLDFKMCVDNALSQNPEMRVSGARIEQAQSALGKAQSSRLPQITASFTAANSNNALNVFGMKLQQREVVQEDFIVERLNDPDAHTDFNTRLEMLVPIYNGGIVTSYENQAAAMIEAARQGNVAVQQMLTYHIYQAYESVHAARAYIAVAEQAKLTAQSFVKTTQSLVEQGVLVRSEFLSAQVNESSASVALMKAQGQEQIALDNLRMLMSMEPGAPLDVGARQDLSLPTESMDELVGLTLADNPQLEAKRKEANVSEFAVDEAKAAYYPNFNIMLRQDWNDQNLGLSSSSYTVAGMVSWKITDFGVTNHSVDMANAAAAQQKATVQSESNKARLEVMTAWRKLQIYKQQVQADVLAVEQAEEAQRLIMQRFNNGVATITEVLASQTQLDKARADLVGAQYETNVEKARLRLATGTMDVTRL
ncbi:TolC family protein [Thiomicrorhabdus aquaedulcis]|uniref:TolC family protein n=1 Tax=Thiomicrorhabdus aquaedulcis TaxID=2211106 RepID=UPI000FDBD223|nr:TolC family protein [Thiomicrorhabdus aquaedulcis]